MSEGKVLKTKPLAFKAKSKKRPIEGEGGARKRRRQEYEEEEEYLDLEVGVNKKIAQVDNLLLADHIAKKIRRFGTDLKPVELSQLDISRMFIYSLDHNSYLLGKPAAYDNPANYITDTTSFQNTRTLESLPEFLEQFVDPKKLGEAPKQKGSPHTIIVTSAGLRAAELVRYEIPNLFSPLSFVFKSNTNSNPQIRTQVPKER